MSEPPKSPAGLQGEYAGFASRLIAVVIDLGIIAAVNLVVAWATVSLLMYVGVDLRDCPDLNSNVPIRAAVCHGIQVGGVLAGTWFPIVYGLFFWSATGQTPGSAVMGIRVVRLDGKPMGFGTAVRRMAGFVLSLAAVGVGFLVILADDRRQGWHDKIARTCVIYAWKARGAADFLLDSAPAHRL